MILVVGGTGRLGSAFVGRRAGREPVRVLTRDPARAGQPTEGVEIAIGDLRRPESLVEPLRGARLVVAAAQGFAGPGGGSPRTVDAEGNANLLRAAAAAGTEVVLMSVVGAACHHPMELFRMKAVAEEQAAASGAPTTVVRATAFADLWLDLLRETAARSGRPMVFGRGDNPINFVAVADVAELLDRVVDDPSTRGRTLEIGGPANLSFNQLVALLRRAEPGLGAPRHLPPAILALVGGTIGRLKPQLGRQTRAALAMDRIDLTFDDARGSARELYPYLPSTPVADLPQPRTAAVR